MRHSETIATIAPAVVEALHEIEGPAKDTKNPHFGKQYASLGSVLRASKEILHKHGLAVLQFPGAMVGGVMTLDTVILHKSGEWMSGDEPFGVAVQKSDPQGVGSALTYARRYGQMAALNMTAEDDDGEAAMQRQPPQQRQEPKRPEGVVSGAVIAAKASIDLCMNPADLSKWTEDNGAMLDKMGEDDKKIVRAHYAARQRAVRAAA